MCELLNAFYRNFWNHNCKIFMAMFLKQKKNSNITIFRELIKLWSIQWGTMQMAI